jgi:hypothetical protein
MEISDAARRTGIYRNDRSVPHTNL